MVKPNFFIVGAPKCGTTAMYTYLDAHPVFMPDRKEPHFFGSDLEHLPIDARSRDEYLGLFAPAGDKKRIGEASVYYMISHTAAQEIAAFNPAAHIIIMLREPVDMLHSLYHHLLYSGSETEATFEAALAAEPDRRAGRRLPTVAAAIAVLPRNRGLYGTGRALFQRLLGDAVHVILFDDPARHRRAVPGCAGVPGHRPGFQPDFRRVNESRRSQPAGFAGIHLSSAGA